MNETRVRVLSRLSDEDFVGRETELRQLLRIARAAGPETNLSEQEQAAVPAQLTAPVAILLGAPGSGKSALLRQVFDRLFNAAGEVIPFYYSVEPALSADRLARDYVSQFLAQFIAFRRQNPSLVDLSDQAPSALARLANPEDYVLIRDVLDAFERAGESSDGRQRLRSAFSMPSSVASRIDKRITLILDDVHQFSVRDQGSELSDARLEFVRAIIGSAPQGRIAYVLGGLRRPLLELLPPDRNLLDRVEFVNIAPLADGQLEAMIRAAADRKQVEVRDSTIELMIQQLNRDVFYLHSIIDAAAARGSGLKTFMDFERVYTEEMLGGRLNRYLAGLLREIAPDPVLRRIAVEILAMVVEAGGPVPLDGLSERVGRDHAGVEALLARLHAHELLNVSYGFVAGSQDPVLADFVRVTYRNEISGAHQPIAGEALLGEKLRQSYRLMMSRYNRAMQAQLIDLVSRFDFQGVPASLFDQVVFDRKYRGLSRVQVRRALEDEQQRVRLPQIVLVEDQGSGDQSGIAWRVFRATGFEGGIYSDANEARWWITLINSKEPVDLDTMTSIVRRVHSSTFGSGAAARDIRWHVSKEGFSAACAEKLSAEQAYFSTYAQLDLIVDSLTRNASGESVRPASEFELVIPIEDEAELIAARTVEQIARAAEFGQDAVNQIKTALIEACINAAEHSDSPDRRIHHRFSVEDDRLTITVANKGKKFDTIDGHTGSVATATGRSRGRGLQIIRALMDDVHFEPSDDGATLVMTKLLRRPENQ